MIEEEATVVATRPGWVRVVMMKSDACACCAARSACQPGPGTTMELEVADPLGASPGQRVVIAMPAVQFIRASAAAYLFPAAAIVCGAAFGWSRTGTDGGALLGAGLGLVLALAVLAVFGRKLGRDRQPRVERILP